jgi:hypothetical protein
LISKINPDESPVNKIINCRLRFFLPDNITQGADEEELVN